MTSTLTAQRQVRGGGHTIRTVYELRHEPFANRLSCVVVRRCA